MKKTSKRQPSTCNSSYNLQKSKNTPGKGPSSFRFGPIHLTWTNESEAFRRYTFNWTVVLAVMAILTIFLIAIFQPALTLVSSGITAIGKLWTRSP